MPVGPSSFLRLRPPAPRGARSASANLHPSLADRAVEFMRPGWARTVAARRAAAGALVVLAVVLAIRDDPGAERASVVVAVRDLSPGHALTADDVVVADREAATVPAGTLTNVSDAVGHTLAGPVPAGEGLVDTRILGPRLAAAATGLPDARVVPIRLADAGVGDLLREGDRVDVLTVAGESTTAMPDAHVLARGAVVVLAEHSTTGREQRERVVLVALEPEQATAVAAASLVNALTVTLH
ncbi:SAF domain-containing protein [Rhodococcus chondri]|uniref:SAF domain-containing protein n=1 Tax=Rhodococcus chondri TaxID=3065941 RepID=A0ABU7JNH9_9NOCA|nr:SAF domain-containing protein [Rhodococcus sp. CC-R104]MEE2031594.1 SAF domain-containing protein [Rhodococcus sp. CC-R104]